MTRETWKSARFFQLCVLMVLALLLVPLQLRFQVLWLVLSLLYLGAVMISLPAGRYRRLRWAFLVGWVLVLVLKLAPVAEPQQATLFYTSSRVLVAVLLGGCIIATLDYVLRGAEISLDRIFAAIVAYMLAGL
ncbi:MAG: hypothetical protein ACRDGH_18105, partial [Candidatus Limnocylindria bacterium]